jgi:hypothetical protein
MDVAGKRSIPIVGGVECSVAKINQPFVEGKFLQLVAEEERRFVNRVDRCRDGQFGNGVAVERRLADNLQALAQRQLRERRVG